MMIVRILDRCEFCAGEFICQVKMPKDHQLSVIIFQFLSRNDLHILFLELGELRSVLERLRQMLRRDFSFRCEVSNGARQLENPMVSTGG